MKLGYILTLTSFFFLCNIVFFSLLLAVLSLSFTVFSLHNVIFSLFSHVVSLLLAVLSLLFTGFSLFLTLFSLHNGIFLTAFTKTTETSTSSHHDYLLNLLAMLEEYIVLIPFSIVENRYQHYTLPLRWKNVL